MYLTGFVFEFRRQFYLGFHLNGQSFRSYKQFRRNWNAFSHTLSMFVELCLLHQFYVIYVMPAIYGKDRIDM